jgi:hypothetical protein
MRAFAASSPLDERTVGLEKYGMPPDVVAPVTVKGKLMPPEEAGVQVFAPIFHRPNCAEHVDVFDIRQTGDGVVAVFTPSGTCV